MKKIVLTILGVQIFANPNTRGNVCALIIKPSNQLVNSNGTQAQAVELNEGQLRRVVSRALGIYNPVGFKHIVELSNGSAQLTIDAETCKVGDAWENKATGEKGTYTKDWTKYANHEVKLGMVATMKLAEMSLTASFNAVAQGYAQAPTRTVAVQAEQEVSKEESTNV